jgi:hypothetical protein
MARAGEGCEHEGCPGRLGVYCTRIKGRNRKRYLRCSVCNRRPCDNVYIVPVEFAPREQRGQRMVRQLNLELE